MESIVKDDPYWLDKSDQHRTVAIQQGVLGPTAPWPSVYNPGYAQADAEHIWGVAESNVINGMKPEDAAAKVFDRMKAIFAKYPVA